MTLIKRTFCAFILVLCISHVLYAISEDEEYILTVVSTYCSTPGQTVYQVKAIKVENPVQYEVVYLVNPAPFAKGERLVANKLKAVEVTVTKNTSGQHIDIKEKNELFDVFSSCASGDADVGKTVTFTAFQGQVMSLGVAHGEKKSEVSDNASNPSFYPQVMPLGVASAASCQNAGLAFEDREGASHVTPKKDLTPHTPLVVASPATSQDECVLEITRIVVQGGEGADHIAFYCVKQLEPSKEVKNFLNLRLPLIAVQGEQKFTVGQRVRAKNMHEEMCNAAPGSLQIGNVQTNCSAKAGTTVTNNLCLMRAYAGQFQPYS